MMTQPMIDLHCHILPGVDDGAQTMEDTLAMAHKAVDQGITHILCTPHYNNGQYDNKKGDIIPLVNHVQHELDVQQIQLQLLPGQETHISDDLVDCMARDEVLYTDLQEQYLLLEFPSSEVPIYAQPLFAQILALGKTPVIVHPERNDHFIKAPNDLITYLEMGCLSQLTAPSYLGIFGKQIQKTAKLMVQHNLVQCIASDAHGLQRRNFYLQEALQAIHQDFGETKVTQFLKTARALVNGDEILVTDYTSITKAKPWWKLI